MKEIVASRIKNIVEWILCILIAILLAILIRYFIGTPTMVQKISMYPTLVEGERLWLSRWIRTTKGEPKHGEIVTFEAPSKRSYIYGEADLSNPTAIYSQDPKGVLQKFNYHVLEIGKISYIKRVIGLPRRPYTNKRWTSISQ